MYRQIYLMKRKPGLTHQQFRDYYETKHRLLSEKAINGYALSYERYYLSPTTAKGAEPIYDAVIQLCFPDRDTFARCISAHQKNSEAAKIMAEDELNFLDLEAYVRFEAQDSFSKLQPLPPSNTVFRIICFARRRPDMTHEQCRAYYENKHRLLGEYITNGYAYTYDRHYLYKIAPDAPEPYYTFIMEMKFPTPDGFKQITANMVGDPTIKKLIAEDEARFIDRTSALFYIAEVSASVLEPLALVPAA